MAGQKINGIRGFLRGRSLGEVSLCQFVARPVVAFVGNVYEVLLSYDGQPSVIPLKGWRQLTVAKLYLKVFPDAGEDWSGQPDSN